MRGPRAGQPGGTVHARRRDGPRRRAASLVESCLALLLLCLLFSGLFQLSRLLAAREILGHAAARAARARTVGFNEWMVTKSVRVAAIPNAGRMTQPEYVNENTWLRQALTTMRPGQLWTAVLQQQPASSRFEIEIARIPEYLASENASRARHTLNYTDWLSLRLDMVDISPGPNAPAPILEATVTQDVPLTNALPGHRAFYAADTIELSGEAALENHYSLYIEDMYW